MRQRSAKAVTRLRQAGAVIVGKTNPTGNADVQASNPVFGRRPSGRSRTSAARPVVAPRRGDRGRVDEFDTDQKSMTPPGFRLTSAACSATSDVAVRFPLVGHIPGAPGEAVRTKRYGLYRGCRRAAPAIIPALQATVGPLNPDGGFLLHSRSAKSYCARFARHGVGRRSNCPVDKDVHRALDGACRRVAQFVHGWFDSPPRPSYGDLARTLPQSGDGRLSVDRSTISRRRPPCAR